MAARKKIAKKSATKQNSPKATSAGSALVSRYAAALTKRFGEGKALIVSEEQRGLSAIHEALSTGVDVVDHYVLATGGLPGGRMTEIFGAENAGKTSLGYSAIAMTQRAGGVAVWIDSELAFDDRRAAQFSCDPENMLLMQPDTLEELFDQLKATLSMHDPHDGPMLVVWDSIAAAVTKQSALRDAGDRKVGDVPLVMSEELKKVRALAIRKRAHIMMMNQVRSKIGVMFGDNTTTPGGNAPKFYADQRLQFLGGKAVKNSKGEHIAKIVTVIAVKNRFAPPYRKARVRLDYASGFNNIWSTVWHAKVMKLIKAREDGFAGPSREGLAALEEALKKLGWKSSMSLSALTSADADIELDIDEEETENDDDDADDDDADDSE